MIRVTGLCRLVLLIGLAGLASCGDETGSGPIERGEALETIELPAPRLKGERSLEEVLAQRRSIREFGGRSLSREEISQLAWAAQGTTDADGHRTAPSAGPAYPLELWIVLPEGLYHYEPQDHRLILYRRGDLRSALPAAAYDQKVLAQAPAVFVLCGVVDRMAAEYDAEIAPRYVQLEAGHAAQNLLLQATALDLGAVPVGGIDSDLVRAALGGSPRELPLYLIPIGARSN